MMEIIVPDDPSEVRGFRESVHDALASASEERIEFVGNHTVAARILCGDDSLSLWASTSGNVTVKSMTIKSGVGLYIGRSSVSEKSEFRKGLREELKSGKAVTFTGEAHTGIAEAFKNDITIRCITGGFISTMENGELPPWKRPWKLSRPTSFDSGKPYRGVNPFRLAQVAQERGYVSPWWITANRASKEGHPVKIGERGTMIVSPIPDDGDSGQNEDDDYEDAPPPKGFFCQPVFNLNQCEGMERVIHPPQRRRPRRQSAQRVIDRYINREREQGLEFDERGGRASYSRSKDRITVPRTRVGTSEYYIKAFHQIARSTGHSERCDRRDGNKQASPGNHKRGREELIVEMTTSLLSAETGLDFRVGNASSYIEGWLGVIQRNPDMLIRASFQATTAMDYILNRDNARKKIRAQRKKRREQELKRKNRTSSGNRGRR